MGVNIRWFGSYRLPAPALSGAESLASRIWPRLCSVLAIALTASALTASQARAAAEDKGSSPEKERSLIRTLTSKAPPDEKALACKQLSISGTKKAVPALAALLTDRRLASWARIALEAIPDPAADAALRRAMGKLKGNLAVGVINSVGNRRDAQAVTGLAKKLKDGDAQVASAAAVALGKIGGDKAARALERALPSAPAEVRPAIAEGCIRCAEGFLAQQKTAEAITLYDLVRGASVPQQKILEATRGAILARGPDGIPLLLDQLRAADKAQFGMGLRTARELPGREVTETLAAELQQCAPNRQPRILLALAERGDPAALPVVVAAAGDGPKELRLMAVGLLERLGNVTSVPALLEAAVSSDAELAQAAEGVLARLPGKDVDADLLSRLSPATGKLRRILIELAAQRRIDGALPGIVASLQDGDAHVCTAAVQAVGSLGAEREAVELAKLVEKTHDTKHRADIEAALVAIAGRKGAASVPPLLPLMQSNDSATRILALHALAGAGGPEALAAVRAALSDKDEAVQDEAVRTLSTWPNTWPEDDSVAEPLLALARSSQKTSHQVLGLRGYLEYVQTDKKLQDTDKPGKIKELLPLFHRPEEKRLAIAAIGAIPTAITLELLIAFADEPVLADEACTALLKLSEEAKPGITAAERQKALRTVVEQSKNGARKKKAQEKLTQLTSGK